MVIDAVEITLTRTGEKATLLCQGRPLGVIMNITLPELEHLALYLAHEVGLWRDELIEAEQSAPVSAPTL